MAAIKLNNISKSYGDVDIIKNLNLNIEDGEFIVLVGPSGCGKSTLLRMVCGLESISSGELSIGENIVNDLDPGSRDLAMVFQSYALYPHMSVRENISFGLKVRKTPQSEIDKLVSEVASMLGLENLLERLPKQLSGGQRQRVAMGRAIVRRPKAFLFDEPLSNLDAKLRTEVRAQISKIHKELKTTTLYVTHDQVEAMTLADKVVILNKGNIEQAGSPEEVYRKPANTFVASFIGSPTINLFDLEKSETSLKFKDFDLSIPADLFPAGTAILGIRPGDLSFSKNETGNSVSLGKIDFDRLEYLGSNTIFYSDAGSLSHGSSLVLEAGDQDAEAKKVKEQYLSGQKFEIFADPSSLSCFDKDGKRLESN